MSAQLRQLGFLKLMFLTRKKRVNKNDRLKLHTSNVIDINDHTLVRRPTQHKIIQKCYREIGRDFTVWEALWQPFQTIVLLYMYMLSNCLLHIKYRILNKLFKKSFCSKKKCAEQSTPIRKLLSFEKLKINKNADSIVWTTTLSQPCLQLFMLYFGPFLISLSLLTTVMNEQCKYLDT